MAVQNIEGGRRQRFGAHTALPLGLVVLVGFILPTVAPPGDGRLPAPLEPDLVYAAADVPCGSTPMPDPDEVITGSFGRDEEGDYVMVPFEVPVTTTAVRVKYCHDQPQLAQLPGTSTVNKHTLDMGVYGARSGPDDVWDEDEFRGWGGSSRKDVTISPEGSIDPDPAPVATQETTIGYRPGPIEAGEWAVELGVAAIGQEFPGEDGRVQWRVEIDLITNPAFADAPYQPATYDEEPADLDPGWYAGDFHVHARHSAPGDATMEETFDFAFAPLGLGAGLDFITLSDYVSDRAWGEIGAFQADYPGKLIVRSSEVITYRGHINSHASGELVDYRTGRLLEREDDGSLGVLRAARPASEILAQIRTAGGWSQLNHVETFPSEVPTFSNLCRGCSWEYSDAETDYSLVDAIEVATGPGGLQADPEPGPNPFTPLAIQFWEDAIDSGGANTNHIAAVGSSDSHNAGTPDDPTTQSPIGQATTVVRAEELSEQGIGEGVRAGHTYVKIWGADGPDLRLEATAPDSSKPPAIMGDTLDAETASFTARVLNLDTARAARPGAYTLFILRDGLPFQSVPIPPSGDSFVYAFESLGPPARYRLQVQRTVSGAASIEALSSPIYLDPAAAGADPDEDEPGGAPGAGDGPGGGGAGDVAAGGSAGSAGDVAGDCENVLRGSMVADRLRGTAGSDRIHGRGGDDRITGSGGEDCLGGGRGEDRITAGPGEDVVRAGGGADRVNAADGKRDVIRCGSGRDRVRADREDRMRGCELVRRE